MSEAVFEAQGRRNTLQTFVLLAGMAGLLGAVGYGLAGVDGLALLLGFGTAFMWFAPTLSGRMIMRAIGAMPLTARRAPLLHRILRALSRRAGLAQPPALFYLPDPAPQAFTIGDRAETAAICVSEGMLRMLASREIAGVLAHEIAHVVNRDLRVMILADLVTRMTRTMSVVGLFLAAFNVTLWASGSDAGSPWWLPLLMVLAPTIGTLLQLALSRTREFEADRAAARLSGDPEGLARALVTLETRARGRWERFLRPRGGRPEPSVLRTHPETAERVARLQALIPDAEPLSEVQSAPSSFEGSGRGPRPPAPWLLSWWR